MAEDIPLPIRKLVYARDNGKCRWCGRTNAGLHLHHVIYRSTGGRHLVDNLICLCPEHHALVHSDKPFYQPILLDLLQEDPVVTGFQLVRWKLNGERRHSLHGLRNPDPSDGQEGNSREALPGARSAGAVGRLISLPDGSAPSVRDSLSRMRGPLQHDEREERDAETDLDTQEDLR